MKRIFIEGIQAVAEECTHCRIVDLNDERFGPNAVTKLKLINPGECVNWAVYSVLDIAKSICSSKCLGCRTCGQICIAAIKEIENSTEPF